MGFGKDGKGVIIRETIDQSIGAMASRVVILVPSAVVLEEDFRMLKTELFATVVGLDAGEGEGLLLGMANGNLTALEIEASIEAQGPKGPSDRVIQELAERQFHMLGEFRHIVAVTDLVFIGNSEWSAGVKSKFRWTYTDTDKWTFFLYLNSPASIATGWNLAIQASHYGVWLV